MTRAKNIVRKSSCFAAFSVLIAAGQGYGQDLALQKIYGPIQPGQTLWGIAAQLKPEHSHATIAQLAWALYRENPDAFNGSPDQLKQGVALQVPNCNFMEQVSAQEAKQQLFSATAVAGAPKLPDTAVSSTEDAEKKIAIARVMAPVEAAEQPPDLLANRSDGAQSKRADAMQAVVTPSAKPMTVIDATAFIEASAGYDNNARGASDYNTFVGFELDNRVSAQDSPYVGAAFGVTGSYPIAPGFLGTFGFAANQQYFSKAHFMDSTFSGLNGGFETRLHNLTVGLSLGSQLLRLDDNLNSGLLTVDTYMNLPFGEAWRGGMRVRYGRTRHDSALQIQDVDETYVALYSEGSLKNQPRIHMLFSLMGGHDQERLASSPFGRSLYSGRFAFTYLLSRNLTGYYDASFIYSDYSGLFFGAPRVDRQYQSTVGMEWHTNWFTGIDVSPQFTTVNNHSDAGPFNYRRWDARVTLRKKFR